MSPLPAPSITATLDWPWVLSLVTSATSRLLIADFTGDRVADALLLDRLAEVGRDRLFEPRPDCIVLA